VNSEQHTFFDAVAPRRLATKLEGKLDALGEQHDRASTR
jgi:hypothetical protein